MGVISGPAYQFSDPVAMVRDGDNLFVADNGGDEANGSVTELDASTGALVRVISGPTYQFAGPEALALYGPDLFVANEGSVTELSAATGKLVRVISGFAYHFDGPDAIALSGADLIVANGGHLNDDGDLVPARTVTELNASTGTLVRVISGSAYHFDSPGAMAVSGADLFVTNGHGDYGVA